MSFSVAPLVTHGFGTGNLIVTLGFGPISAVAKVVRGGRSLAKKLYADKLEQFKISVMLLELNGKELVNPISATRKFDFEDTKTEVKIQSIKVQKKQKRIFSVVANILNVKRGSDGED